MLATCLFAVVTMLEPAVAQVPADVLIEARLVRGEFTINSTQLPQWEVELKYRNQTSAPQRLGQNMFLIAPVADQGSIAGSYVSRQIAANSQPLETQVRFRYAMLFGVDVPPSGSTFWPLVFPGMSRIAVLFAVLSAPTIRALPGGGYGEPLQPNEERIIRETILFPYDTEIRGERQSLVLVPPVPVADRGTSPFPIRLLTFDVQGAVTKGTVFNNPRIESVPTEAGALRAIVKDEAIPIWKRIVALNWLAEAHPGEAADPLVAYATKHPPGPLRTSAVINLGVFKIPGALPALLDVAQADSADKAPRAVAIAALGELGDLAAAPLLRTFAQDSDEPTARFSIEALATLKDAAAVPVFSTALAKRSPELRHIGAQALIRVGGPAAEQAAITILRDRKQKDDVRQAVAVAAGNAKAGWTVPALAAILSDERDRESVRAAAATQLGQIYNDEARVALEQATQSTRKKVRESAANALRRAKQPPPQQQN